MTTKVKTWLPVFPGFYGTHFEADEDGEIYDIKGQREQNNLSELPFEAIQFDYDEYHNTIGENACAFILNKLDGFVLSVEFECINSPKYYNYSNDTIHCEIELDNDCIYKIHEFITDHKEDFEVYLHDRYTSYSGFTSFYSNKYKDWMFDFKENLKDKHKLGAYLDFIVKHENITEDAESEMLEYCQQNGGYIYAGNYEDCISKEFDEESNEFID